jgi:hypothetical protein
MWNSSRGESRRCIGRGWPRDFTVLAGVLRQKKGLNFTSWTPWKYDTGEETAVSVVGTFAKGGTVGAADQTAGSVTIICLACGRRSGPEALGIVQGNCAGCRGLGRPGDVPARRLVIRSAPQALAVEQLVT